MGKLAYDIGSRIRALRVEKGLSLRQFALMTDLDKSHLSSIERGRIDLKASTLDKILKGLDVSPAEFFSTVR